MGNINSRLEEGSTLYLKDQTRLSVASLVVSNGRRKTILNLTPNGFPAARIHARRDIGDDTPITYIHDPDASSPSFLLRLDNEDELDFRFTFVTRQTQITQQAPSNNAANHAAGQDTSITGLTFAQASTSKELDTLITREFHADPNLHKNSNVQHIGDYSTNGSPAVQYEWSWKWRPPKASEDRGGGWRNSCSFLEYDSRAHRLNTLASFAFWVHNNTRPMISTPLASPGFELTVPVNRHRVPSSQSYQSTVSDSEGNAEAPNPPSPVLASAESSSSFSTVVPPTIPVIDVSCQRPGEDMSAVEDGPLFRATMKSLEQKTGNMRVQMKKVLRKAEAAQQAQVDCNFATKAFLVALQEASASNASAFKPALDNYFNKIAQRILQYETENSVHLQKQIIEPLSKLYNLDIKQAEFKKKDFEDESRDYYAYVGRYLGQRQDSMKDKKRAESDSKYQVKRRNFELKRFDYSSFMTDLHGGRKEQELLSQLTKYADGQAQSFLETAKKVESLTPQLDALVREVAEADKEFKFQRTEREEKRRNLEKNTSSYSEPDTHSQLQHTPSVSSTQHGQREYNSDTDLSRADSTSSQLGSTYGSTLSPSNSLLHSSHTALGSSPGGTSTALHQNKFQGIRDLEERSSGANGDKSPFLQQRKEGLCWALSKPNSHIDPVGINKQAWHKFWVVLDQGKLSEYSNWKDKLDLHRDPIDLRMASVRMARDADRRFCFEVITPHFKRVYQATGEEEMTNWINSINNALQSAVEGRARPTTPQGSKGDLGGRDIGSVLTGKSSSQSGPHGHSHRSDANGVSRRITVGARPSYVRTNSNSFQDNPTKLLDQVRAADQGNTWCADCGSSSKVEWVSINLGIILCIECSGIHRSLGTHISKVRSLTLDIHSFTNDIVDLILLIGNRVSNMVWEARLDQSMKPGPHSNREQRLKFITAKYVERAYVEPIVHRHSQSHFTTADEVLLTSIKKNEIQGVLQGIALRGNVNAHDRSRNTHAVFLALAAADPAHPSTTSATSATSATPSPNSLASGPSPSVSPPGKAFAMAELLVQNGAEIPSQLPAIPLSTAAQLYIDQRTMRSTATTAGAFGGGGSGNQSRDQLGPLPVVMQGFRGGTSLEGRSEKDQTRLQKRGSAGSRFAGKVVGLGGER